jgi:hypothetical protein
MSRLRLVFGLVMALGMLELLATPAFAEFSSTKLSGPAKAGSSVFEGGGGTVECKEAAGEWKSATETAAAEKLLVKKWTGCTASSGSFKGVEATISECQIELGSSSKGITKEAEILATVLSKQCVVTAKIVGITCEIKIGPESNKGLKKGKGTNEGANVAVIAEFTGITDTLGGTCPGIVATKEAKEKAKILLEGEKLAGSSATETSLTTSLSGESKSGETITVLEGAAIKDKATLSGTNAGKAGGTVKYAVYSDKECKTLVTAAGEVTVKSGSVPESSEEKLTAGASYYWQATYSGDSNNLGSTSTCGSEVSTVKASTSLTTLLFGEEQLAGLVFEGEEIKVPEGTVVVDTATLSGTNASTATGTVKYAAYSDKECKTLATKAGEATVANEIVLESSEEKLKAGTYYWQAAYSGDTLHQSSTSACGKEITIIEAATLLKTSLSGEGKEGAELKVAESTAVSDVAQLSGTNAPKATGTVKYALYSDGECKELVAKAGEVSVTGESVPKSTKETLSPGIYYWQAVYSGDAANYSSTSLCDSEVEFVTPSVTTSLSSEGESGEELEILEGAGVSDKATLHGEHASTATGTVKYKIYSDSVCKELVTEAGKATVSGENVPASSEEKLKPGTYYWLAEYSGDSNNPAGKSACGKEVMIVQTSTSLTGSLSGEKHSGEKIEVQEGAAVSDTAALGGTKASTANGYIEYDVYSDSECKELTALAGDVEVTKGSIPTSSEVTLPVGTYYWQATYSGDEANHSSTSSCGSEVETVTAPVTTSLTGEEHSGNEIEVQEKAAVSDKATLHGEHASIATGTVKYNVYSDSECKELAAKAGEVTVKSGSVPASSNETLSAGSYYWLAEYSGDSNNPAAKSACGTEIAVVLQPEAKYAGLGDSYSSGQGTGTYYGPTDITRSDDGKNECHRSNLAYPARIAKLFFGEGAIAENEVFKEQPPSFIFRACSGAVTRNIGGNGRFGGQWAEWFLDAGNEWSWILNTAQYPWLELPAGFGGQPNNAIRLITLTIGGNDAGFAKIAENCTMGLPDYTRNKCLVVIKEWITGTPGTAGTLKKPSLEEGIPSIGETLPAALSEIHKAAPKARIRVPLYPQVLNRRINGNISVGPGGFAIENTAPRGQTSIAYAMERFTTELNEEVQSTVEAWAKKERVDAKAITGTIFALRGHRLGDVAPWMNGIFLFPKSKRQESFHPTCNGQIALATEVTRGLEHALPGPGVWTC